MSDSEVLIDEKLSVSERFRVELKAFKVKPSEKYPEGIKSRYALIDVIQGKPRVLVDNHAPFGFHAHTRLPKDKTHRIKLETSDYLNALDEFWLLVLEIIDNET